MVEQAGELRQNYILERSLFMNDSIKSVTPRDK